MRMDVRRKVIGLLIAQQIDLACGLENVKGDWPKELIMSYVQRRSE